MADEIVSRGMFLSVAGACDCCDDVEAPSDVVLQRFPDDLLPPKGITRGMRLTVRESDGDEAAGDVDQLILEQLRRVAASGLGRIDDDGVIVVPGVLVAACDLGH